MLRLSRRQDDIPGPAFASQVDGQEESAMSGAAAFKKLEQLAQLGQFKTVIQSLNYGSTDVYDDRSCMMNNVAVLKTLTNQQIVKSDQAAALAGLTVLKPSQGMNGQHTTAVMKALEGPVIVAFSLQFKKDNKGAGDHYFSAFQLDSKTIVASMGWQGLYDLTEWFSENDGGRFATNKFEALMLQIENGDISGVEGLCGFLGTTREGKSIPWALSQEIAGCKPRFVNTCYLNLPGR
jgi:hypothetical protein